MAEKKKNKAPIGCNTRHFYRKEGNNYVCMYCGHKSKELTYDNRTKKTK